MVVAAASARSERRRIVAGMGTTGSEAKRDGEGCFLPNLCDARVLFLAVLVAELLAFLFALAASSHEADFWGYLAFASMFVQWVNARFHPRARLAAAS